MSKELKNIYEPAEDSKLLLKYSLKELENKESNLNIIEIGVGSGFVITNLQRKFSKNNFFGTDINKFAIDYTTKLSSKLNTKFGNLFEPFQKSKFDLILFNTPYFPIEDGAKLETLSIKDRAIYGGKKGWETIKDFIEKSKNHFKENGITIMIFSSLSNIDVIKKSLEENLFTYQFLEEENYFFEKIYCLKFYPLKFLPELKLKKVSKIKFLAKGKHSIVLEGFFQNKKAIIKIGKFKDIQIEEKFLLQLKNELFVPEIYFSSKEYVIREKIKGKTIKEFLLIKNKEDIEIVLNKIFKITHRLDELKINKQEMTNPYKHIFIESNLNIKMIDYERCLFTDKPKNTTQFLQYIKKNIKLLNKKGIKIDEKIILEISKEVKLKNKKIYLENFVK